MSRDQLEFQISQYLDGTLSAQQRLELEKQLSSDPEARAFFNEMQRIDQALKTSMALPPIRWDKLCDGIAASVALEQSQIHGESLKLAPVSDEVESAIMGHIEGELTQHAQTLLDEQLASNAAAREALAQHRSLDVLLKHAWPVPDVNFDRLQQHISSAVAQAAADDQRPVIIKLAPYLRRAAAVAIAACVLIVISLAAWSGRNHNSTTANGPQPHSVIEVAIDSHDSDGDVKIEAGAPAVADVSFGPSADYSRDRIDPYGSGGIVPLRSQVQVAETASAARIGAFLPY